MERHDTCLGNILRKINKEEVRLTFRTQKKDVEVEGAEDGKSLMLRKVFFKPEPKIQKPVQRNSLFMAYCKTKYKVCKVIIDSGSTDNLVSTDMVEKLEMETTAHPNPYKVSWLQKGHQVMVTKQCLV
jgi:hypothetical protein